MPKQLLGGEVAAPVLIRGVPACADLRERMGELLIGQNAALDKIAPFVQLFQAGLSPEGRPVGVFLLLGPTGSGKTKTVEVLAEILHGSKKHFVKVDCGEFQMEHEVAKLIGAPPGYLGHRDTAPMLTQQKLTAVTSQHCGLSILLIDEIEKAAGSMQRILLGILDKANVRLGDNTTVDFSNTIIFLTSNLGASEMTERAQGYGLGASAIPATPHKALESIGIRAVKRRFSPEFVNRIDCTLVYECLTRENMEKILELELEDLHLLIEHRLADGGFALNVSTEACTWLLDNGFSREYGARNLKRLIHREILQPAAAMFVRKQVAPGASVVVTVEGNHLSLN